MDDPHHPTTGQVAPPLPAGFVSKTHFRPVLLVWLPTRFNWASCSLDRAGEQCWEFCRDEDHAAPSYLALRSPLCRTELRGHPAPGDRAGNQAGETPSRQGRSPPYPKTPSSTTQLLQCLHPPASHHPKADPALKAGPRLCYPKAGSSWSPVHTPSCSYWEVKGWPTSRPCAAEGDGWVFLGSATSYLPL